ncbi:NAD(P)H-dependent oxidoreductase [Pseudoflavonifractor phocaeensis]|uniref:NAD(P)H-dependent oxidoreductase n=1 Tax=Pseudoflavonifractor phocaeensis TaxID=1870988 RepID=UPI00195A67C2|nr:NAD(P)H-dependent oxidoreductase [Pseudoflavonifractor phocaeensis]MBM6924491.1 flavodoxin family protein [Pseudoflavonifractor phocaeensis]
MNLIMSDRHLELPPADPDVTKWVDLSQMKITNCVGCFGCWTKTPGKCVIRDDAVKIYPLMAASDRVLYVTRVVYGCYDTVMKTMLERAIPVQKAFIRLLHGESHHYQRRVVPKRAVVLGYGEVSCREREIFRRLVERNASNMNFQDVRVEFGPEDGVEQAVRDEVLTWERY